MKKYKIAFLSLALAMASCATISPKTALSTFSAQKIEDISKINWQKILPTPPQADSAAQKLDMDLVILAQKSYGDARWQQAVEDANIDGFMAFDNILGADFNSKNYSDIAEIFAIMNKASLEISHGSKAVYFRPRPFVLDNSLKTCPNALAHGSSFPSGHSALGWAQAAVLARIFPHKADDLFQRGREYGESRIYCAVHFPSDVVAGRVAGDVLLQKLETDAQFIKLLYSAQEKAKLGIKG